MNNSFQRIVIGRKDNIGDVILTFPMASLLKQHFPHVQIILLARHYVKDIVQCCPDIDQFIAWDDIINAPEQEAIKQLRALNADIFINIIPDKRMSQLAKKAKIKTRIGTIRRWYHLLYCNTILFDSRRNPNKHETELNVEMLKAFKIKSKITVDDMVAHIRLNPNTTCKPSMLNLIDKNKFNLIVQPGTNGHTKEWPATHFRELINTLDQNRFNIFITGTQIEGDKYRQSIIEQCPHAHDATGKLNLSELIEFMAQCDGVLCGSTGPLHISAALGIKTLGLYPAQRGMNTARWKPIGKQAQTITAPGICDHCTSHPNKITNDVPSCTCMTMLPVAEVKSVLTSWLTKSLFKIF